MLQGSCMSMTKSDVLVCGLLLVLLAKSVQGQTTVQLTASPTITVSMNIINSSIDSNYTGNFSSINPNFTSSIVPYVTPSIISPVSNITATAENVFFVEFKLLSKDWHEDLTKKESDEYIVLSNKVTQQIDQVYSGNNTHYNGSLVLGFRNSSRDGVYVNVKVEYSRTVIVNTSLVDPLMQFFRSGGSSGFVVDQVFFKMSKYADCIITYIETEYCECKTKTYRLQIKCYQPDVIGGEACPYTCWTGQQMSGARPCSWDDLDTFLCSSGICRPHIVMMTSLALLAFLWNMHASN